MKRSSSAETEEVTLLTASVFDFGKQAGKQPFLIEEVGDYIPGAVMIQDLNHLVNRYMNRQGCDILKRSTEELRMMGTAYFEAFFPSDEIKFLTASFSQFIQEADYNKVYSFFQRVRPDHESDYKWYLTTSRLCPPGAGTGMPEIMHISVDVQSLHLAGRHIKNLCNDNSYQIRYYNRFNLLSKREKEIISFICHGLSSYEISDRLFISIHTVNNHRKNILNKLEINSLAQLVRFAVAFGLVE